MTRISQTQGNTPLITLGITCFNAEADIVRTLENAIAQTWKNVEIVVVDDASTDESVARIEEVIAKYPHIRLIRHEVNKGFPSALNTIIDAAKGEFIAFFDDDDLSAPHRLEAQYAHLSDFIVKANTPLVMCYTDREVKYAPDQPAAYGFKAIGRKSPQPHGEMVADYILWHSGRVGYQWGMFGSCTLMVSKALFTMLGHFDTAFRRNTEWDMAIRCALKGGYFIAIPEVLVTQIKTVTSDKAGKTPLKYALLLREKYKDYLEGQGVYQASRLVAYSRFYGGKGKPIMSRLYGTLALIVAPCKLGSDKVSKLISKVKAA
ncbi:MAG: glycosyltransferase family 2 protein [Pseudobdellovibrionaceae bacterium]